MAAGAAALLVAGCQPSEPKADIETQPEPQISTQPETQISEADAAAIVQLGMGLIEADEARKKGSTTLMVGDPEIDALKGTFPRVEKDGAYFRKGFFCVVKERGLFVPRDPAAFVPPATGGASYVPLSRGLYRYERAC